MRVVKIPVQTYQQPAQKPKRKPNAMWPLGIALALVVVQLLRPVPSPFVKLSVPATIPPESTALALPTYGQAAVAAKGYGILGTSGAQEQLSTASIAKVITALCVLERKPIKPGEKGPMLLMTRADVDFFKAEIEHNGSRVDVYEGQKMSEYQAIQALMIPSANNIANTLAVWAFGSLDSYRSYANNYVMRQGLVNTRIGADASGYDPTTVSSASDLTRLGLLVEANPVLLEIAAQTEATFPLAGTMTNYNSLLGQHGITGLKTGNNEQNPGAFLMTGAFQVAGQKVQYSGAVMGADSLSEALASSSQLAASLPSNFENRIIFKTNQTVGTYHTVWGARGELTASRDLSLVRWKDDAIKMTLQTPEKNSSLAPPALTVKSGSQTHTVPLKYKQPPARPTWWWRLTRL
ncbi:MAG: hypothetical protein WBO35_02870 [Candidatus Saccharimonadales bacterium]